jgi:hypothetical protein
MDPLSVKAWPWVSNLSLLPFQGLPKSCMSPPFMISETQNALKVPSAWCVDSSTSTLLLRVHTFFYIYLSGYTTKNSNMASREYHVTISMVFISVAKSNELFDLGMWNLAQS